MSTAASTKLSPTVQANEELRKASLLGDASAVQATLESGADVDAQAEFEEPALHQAARKGHGQVVRQLIAAGADLNARNMDDDTALHVAAVEGHAAVVRQLLTAGSRIGARNKAENTVLHKAAAGGCVPIIQHLVDQVLLWLKSDRCTISLYVGFHQQNTVRERTITALQRDVSTRASCADRRGLSCPPEMCFRTLLLSTSIVYARPRICVDSPPTPPPPSLSPSQRAGMCASIGVFGGGEAIVVEHDFQEIPACTSHCRTALSELPVHQSSIFHYSLQTKMETATCMMKRWPMN